MYDFSLAKQNILSFDFFFQFVLLITSVFFSISSKSNMNSDLKVAPNDKKDTRFRDNRKGSPERWGKPGRRENTPPKETNRSDPHSIRCRVFIGNLQMSRKELEDIFAQYGKVVGCSVHNNYGFVQFEDEKSADAAVAKENGQVYYGKRVGESVEKKVPARAQCIAI